MDNKIWDIIGKKLKGEADDLELKSLEEWLERNKEDIALHEEVVRVWERTGELSRPETLNLDEEWNSFKMFREQEIAKSDNPAELEMKPNSVEFTWLYRIAAVIILGLGFGYFGGYFSGVSEPQNYITHKSGAEKLEVPLPDGSSVWLNKQSQIVYADDFGIDHRTLDLNGEAFFDVRKGTKTFRIISGATVTEVLGTAFNVKHVGTHETEVIVARGKVSFSLLDDASQSVTLEKGDKAILKSESSRIVKSTNKDTNFLSWKEQRLVFIDEDFRTVIETLEGYFKIQITVNDPSLYDCHFTGRFKKPELLEVLDVISASMTMKYSVSGKTVLFSGKGCS